MGEGDRFDRRRMFHDRPGSSAATRSGSPSTSRTGVLTASIFRGTEPALAAMGDAFRSRYAGAVLGLAVGYLLEYRLDRRFVFRMQAAA